MICGVSKMTEFMMPNNSSCTVHIAGPVLASIQFDMLNEDGEIDGFLLGQVQTRIINEVRRILLIVTIILVL